jgi:hypothetical protein
MEQSASLLYLVFCLLLVSCLACSSNLKMEAICSSAMSVDFHRTTPHYIPEDITIHRHRCVNLKTNMAYCVLRGSVELPLAGVQRCLSAWGRSARPQVETLRCHAGNGLKAADQLTLWPAYPIWTHTSEEQLHVSFHLIRSGIGVTHWSLSTKTDFCWNWTGETPSCINVTDI